MIKTEFQMNSIKMTMATVCWTDEGDKDHDNDGTLTFLMRIPTTTASPILWKAMMISITTEFR